MTSITPPCIDSSFQHEGFGPFLPVDLSRSILEPFGAIPDRVLGIACIREGRASGTAEARSALDSIEVHLSDSIFHAGFRVGEHYGRLVSSWNFPSDWSGPPPDGEVFVLKVQPFDLGGYEATVRQVNVVRIGEAMEADRRLGKRVAPEVQSIESIMQSCARAKRKVRLLCRNMMANHMLTLTRAEGPLTSEWGPGDWEAWDSGGCVEWERVHGLFRTPEEWAEDWDRLRRLQTKVIGRFPYVAVLEKHRKGNYHLHIAWVGRINVKLVRKMWLSIVGQRGGNIDAVAIKVPSGHDRSSRIAAYMSKYLVKSYEDDPRFNKRRYWASKQALPEVRRYVLKAASIDAAMDEVKRLLGLDYGKFVVPDRDGGFKNQNLFMFPDGGGAWINFIPGLHDAGPPF